MFYTALYKFDCMFLELLLNESVLSPIVSTLDSVQNSLETNGVSAILMSAWVPVLLMNYEQRELSDSIELVSAHVDRSETYK